ncbi:MAG: Hpt domain-containing protein [Acidobacteriota bacterium]|nr:Hpt domain-containing protein [Acidobacteriota bacterium]
MIDRKAALDRMEGDEVLYRKLAEAFPDVHGGTPAQAAAMLERGDREGARRAAHTLKSAAAMIGAAELSLAAATAEAALSEDGGGDAKMDAAALIREMGKRLEPVLDQLRRDAAARQPSAPGKPFDPAKALAALDQLEPLLAKGSFECLALAEGVDWTVPELGGAGGAFAAAIGDIDWSSARALLPGLRAAVAAAAK